MAMKYDFVTSKFVIDGIEGEVELATSGTIHLCTREDVFEFLNKPKSWHNDLPWSTKVTITTPVKEFEGYYPIIERREGHTTLYLHSLNDRRTITLETYAVTNRNGIIRNWNMTIRNTRTQVEWNSTFADKDTYSAPKEYPIQILQGGAVSPR